MPCRCLSPRLTTVSQTPPPPQRNQTASLANYTPSSAHPHRPSPLTSQNRDSNRNPTLAQVVPSNGMPLQSSSDIPQPSRQGTQTVHKQRPLRCPPSLSLDQSDRPRRRYVILSRSLAPLPILPQSIRSQSTTCSQSRTTTPRTSTPVSWRVRRSSPPPCASHSRPQIANGQRRKQTISSGSYKNMISAGMSYTIATITLTAPCA